MYLFTQMYLTCVTLGKSLQTTVPVLQTLTKTRSCLKSIKAHSIYSINHILWFNNANIQRVVCKQVSQSMQEHRYALFWIVRLPISGSGVVLTYCKGQSLLW